MSKQQGPGVGDDLRKEVEDFLAKKKSSTKGSSIKSSTGGTSSPQELGGDFEEGFSWGRQQERSSAPIDLTNPNPEPTPMFPVAEMQLGKTQTSDTPAITNNGGFINDANALLTGRRHSQIAENMSNKLRGIQEAYSGDKSAIKKAESTPIFNGEVKTGTATERPAERSSYLYNKFLNGVGSLAAAFGDIGATVMAGSPAQGYSYNANNQVKGQTAQDKEKQKQSLSEYRKTIAPQVRNYFRDNIGVEQDEGMEAKYDNEFITSSIGGLAESIPAMVVPAPLRGAAMILQGYDAGIRSLEAADVNGEIDDLTKTIYAAGYGTANGLLEKAGFDRIFKGGTSKLAETVINKSIKEAAEATGKKITGTELTHFINYNVKRLSDQFAKRGVQAVEGFVTEFGTGALQETANIASELLLNSTTGKPIFDTESSFSSWDAFKTNMERIAIGGIQEGIGGGLMGAIIGGAGKAKDVESRVERLESINDELENPNLALPTKELLVQNKIQIQNEITEVQAAAEKVIEAIPEDKLKIVNKLSDKIDSLSEVIADPNLTDEMIDDVKKQIEAVKTEINDKLKEPKPEATVKEVEKEKDDLLSAFEAELESMKVPEATPAAEPAAPAAPAVEPVKIREPETTTRVKTQSERAAEVDYDFSKESNERLEVRLTSLKDRNDEYAVKLSKGISKELSKRTSAATVVAPEVTSLPITDIKTDEKRFQNRDKLDTARVDQIANNFDPNKFDPITVMPDGTVLSGHHRFAAAQQMGMKDVPVKVFQGTEQEAIDFARDSNTLGKQETSTERAARYRDLRKQGKSEKEISEMAKVAHGADAVKIVNMSRLDPKGKALFTIKQFENSTDTDTKGKVQALGDWIGHVKSKHADLSRRQENEMFDYLQKVYSTKKGAGKISNKSQFAELTDALIGRIKDRGAFNEDSVLNFNNALGKTGLELEYDAAMEEAKAALKEANDNLSNKRAQLFSDGATKADLDRIIPQYEEQVQIALKAVDDLRAVKGTVADAVKRQQSIFDTIDNTPENEKTELDTNVSEQITATAEEPGQSGTDDQGSPVEETAATTEVKPDPKAELDKEIEDAFADFSKAIRKSLNAAGLSTEIIEKGLKLVGLYTKKGIMTFQDMLKDAGTRFGDISDLIDGFKAAYSAHYSQAADDVADQMTDPREVRKFDYQQFIKDDGTRIEPDALEENTPGASTTQQPGTTEGATPEQPAEPAPERPNVESSPAGNESGREADGPGRSTDKGGRTNTGTGGRAAGTGSDTDAGERVRKNTPKRELTPEEQNHVIAKDDVIVPSGAVGKLTANMDALFTLRKLESENRNATPEEKKVLAKFVGWGGLAKYLDTTSNYAQSIVTLAAIDGKNETTYLPGLGRTDANFKSDGPLDLTKFSSFDEAVTAVRNRLVKQNILLTAEEVRPAVIKSVLSPADLQSARTSTISAHFTDRRIIDALWNIAGRLGFKGGNVLESSAGIGHILGLMPENMRSGSRMTAYELESSTGRMLKKLYPQAKVTVGGFEASNVPLNSIDLAITNVPFGAKAPYDKSHPELSKFSLHNYFIGKNLKTLKPGGVGIMITSASTMDAPASTKFREWVMSPAGGNSFLVGAIRLPNDAFSENAGTQVTSDILIFQKRSDNHDASLEQPFRYTETLTTGEDQYGTPVDIEVNEYYHMNPDNMLGDMMTAEQAGAGALYGNTNAATLKAKPGVDIAKSLDKAVSTLPENINEVKAAAEVVEEVEIPVDQREGSVFVKNRKPYQVENGKPVLLDLRAKQIDAVSMYTGIREDLSELIKAERNTEGESQAIEDIRANLNEKYDAFVAKHGNINGRGAGFISDLDPDFYLVSSLENESRSIVSEPGKRDKIVSTFKKAGILNHRINYPRTEPTSATNISDAIDISLNFKNGLNVDYISSLLNISPDDVKQQLLENELAYENPGTGLMETPEQYLSGFVREKLKQAETAAESNPQYMRNVNELKKVIPESIPSALISYSLGSAWIPNTVYEDFGQSIFGSALKVRYIGSNGKYAINPIGGRYRAEITSTYAAGGKDGIEILSATLNNSQITVTQTVTNAEGKKSQVKDIEATAAAQAMQQQMQDEFQAWVRNNEQVQEETEVIYNDIYNGFVERSFREPSFDHYPDANVDIKLRSHQKKGVTRGLSESTLFAHQVGTGKTFTIITTAQEMRRLGTARKPMIVVQNSTIGQFVASYRKLYPSAKILAPSKKEMAADGRRKVFARIATGDWDAIIIPQSQFTLIPDDPARETAYIKEQIDEMQAGLLDLDKSEDRIQYMQIENAIKKLNTEIDEIKNPKKKAGKSNVKQAADKALAIESRMRRALDRKTDDVMLFEEMGVDAILVDEAHEYKRLGFATSMSNIKGIDTSKSKKSQSVLLKTRWIQEKTGGKNVLFYTGTPISNTMAEAWTMIKYVRPDILEKLGIQYFDQFAKTFGQVIPSLEQTGGGTFKVQNRFAKFQNLTEFITAFRGATDVLLTEDVKEFQDSNTIPKLVGGVMKQVVVKRTPELKLQIEEFKRTLEWFDNLSGSEKRDNRHIPLVIFGKAKQASIDLRLLNPDNVDSPGSKVNEVVKNALEIYKDSTPTSGTQMIFSDMYQSPDPKDKYLDEDQTIINPAYGKERFNLFEDIKKKLIANGVPEKEIAILTEAKYDKPERKEQLFTDMNAGVVRFALGTTSRMGVGVNAQQKMIGLHHVDAPARPMDFEQRNGRIQRQGNENSEVNILAYGTEKTLDSSAFQRLSTKQKFINQVMKGENVDRVTEDPADEVAMTFDEMMAQLSDSPYAMQKLMVDNKLRSEQMKFDNHKSKMMQISSRRNSYRAELRNINARLAQEEAYANLIDTNFPDGNITNVVVSGTTHTEKFGAAADEYIEMLEKKMNASPTFKAVGFIMVNDLKVEISITAADKIDKETSLLTKSTEMHYTVPEIGIVENMMGKGVEVPSVSGSGLFASLRSRVFEIVDDPARSKKAIEAYTKDIEVLDKDLATPFDETKLNDLQAESEKLKKQMLADNGPKDDPDGDGGGVSVDDMLNAEYIMDQSNIQPALDLLDKLKISNNKTFSLIVPVPPQIWNGAIEVMKAVLKASNSTQKAIRVAARYIQKNGTVAQAKEFTDVMNKNYGPGTELAEKLKTTASKIAISRADLKNNVDAIDLTDQPTKIKADLVNILAEARKTDLIKKGESQAGIATDAITKVGVIRDAETAKAAVAAVKNFLTNVGKNHALRFATSAHTRLKAINKKNRMAMSSTARQLMKLDPKSLTPAELNEYLEIAPVLASQLEGKDIGLTSDVDIANFVDKVIERQEEEIKTRLISRYKKLNLNDTMSVKEMRELIEEDAQLNKSTMSTTEFNTREAKKREMVLGILAINRDDLKAKKGTNPDRLTRDLLDIDENQLSNQDLIKLNQIIGNIVANDRYTGAGYFSQVHTAMEQLVKYRALVDKMGGGFRPITFDSFFKDKFKGSRVKYMSLGDKYLHLNTFREIGVATDNMISHPINVGHSRQMQELNATMKGLDATIKKAGLQRDKKAIYKVGVFAELNAYIVGGADPKVQFANNKELLRRTIEVLSESNNKHEQAVYQILDEIWGEVEGADSAADIENMLTPEEQSVYKYIIQIGKDNQSRLEDNNEMYGDKPMKEKANYIHRRYAKLYSGAADIDIVNNATITSSVNGVIGQAGTKQDVIARRNLPEGKYLDYNIYKSFRLGLNESLNDIHTLGDRIKANYILNSKEFAKTLRNGDGNVGRNLSIIKDSIQQMVQLQRGVARIDIDQDGVGRKLLSFFRQTFYSSAVGTATAALPQYASSVAFTLTNLKRVSSYTQALSLFAEGDNFVQKLRGIFGGGSGSAKELIRTASGGTANRDLQGDNQLEDAMNNLTENVFGTHINPKIGEVFDAFNEKMYASLKFGDRVVSLHTWLAGYIDKLISDGVIKKASEFDLAMLKEHVKNPNSMAATNAETLVSLSNNESDASRRPNAFVAKTAGDELRIDILYPVKKFAVSMNNKLWLGIRNVSEWEGGQQDGLRMIVGAMASVAVYAAVREFIINDKIFDPIGQAITSAMGFPDEEEEEQKSLKMTDEQYKAYKEDQELSKFGINVFSDMVLGGQNVIIEKGTESLANALWKNFGQEIQQEAKKNKEFAPRDLFYVSSDISSMAGIYSKPIGLVLDVATNDRSPLAVALDLNSEAEQTEATQDERNRRWLHSVGIPLATQFVVPSADLERVNNRIKKQVEKYDNARKDITLRDKKNSKHKSRNKKPYTGL